jgi:hypothetical protein
LRPYGKADGVIVPTTKRKANAALGLFNQRRLTEPIEVDKCGIIL